VTLKKWTFGVLLCALAPVAQAQELAVEQRADGVFVFSNNPDRPRQPLAGTTARPAPQRSWRQPAVAPRELRQRITDHALAQDLDPRLVEAVIRVESAFNTRALSHKGAMGLMQLMPGTADDLGVENAFDVDENLRGGTTYLRQLLDRFDGDVQLALAGYNAGPGAVEKYHGVPPYRETSDYVKRILADYGTPAAQPKSKPVPIHIVSGAQRHATPATGIATVAVRGVAGAGR
jgi:soluble lytic murein transglycosylase-like protein